jgi:hypothetical protein
MGPHALLLLSLGGFDRAGCSGALFGISFGHGALPAPATGQRCREPCGSSSRDVMPVGP